MPHYTRKETWLTCITQRPSGRINQERSLSHANEAGCSPFNAQYRKKKIAWPSSELMLSGSFNTTGFDLVSNGEFMKACPMSAAQPCMSRVAMKIRVSIMASWLGVGELNNCFLAEPCAMSFATMRHLTRVGFFLAQTHRAGISLNDGFLAFRVFTSCSRIALPV